MATAALTPFLALAPHITRDQLEEAIELLIAELDARDGDPDLEEEPDAEPEDPVQVFNLFRDEVPRGSGFDNEDHVPTYGVDQDGRQMGTYGAADTFDFVAIAEREE